MRLLNLITSAPEHPQPKATIACALNCRLPLCFTSSPFTIHHSLTSPLPSQPYIERAAAAMTAAGLVEAGDQVAELRPG